MKEDFLRLIKTVLFFAAFWVLLGFMVGCRAYRKYAAPNIPTVRLGTRLGGAGISAEVGIESRWDDEAGERDRGVYFRSLRRDE